MTASVRRKPPGRPPDADSERSHRAIVDAARRAFAARGYGSANIRDIADDAGCAASVVYHYFPSKTDLYVATFADAERAIAEAYDRATRGLASRDERVQAIFDATVALHADDESVPRFLAACALEVARHPELASPIGALRMRTNEILAAVLADGTTPAGQALVRAFGAITIGLALVAPPGRHATYAAMVDAMRPHVRFA